MFLFKAVRKVYRMLSVLLSTLYAKFVFSVFSAKYGARLVCKGLPIIDIHPTAKVQIGDDFTMNSGNNFNRIGRQQKSMLVVGINASLSIGNNVKISSTAIVSYNSIIIADNVMMGGNVVIYDTDFHSLNHEHRTASESDWALNVTDGSKPVIIEKNVFIGAHSTILKGVTIGENSIIAACSVITKSVGANEIWGGNPARLLKKIENVQN